MDHLDQDAITRSITETFAGADVVAAAGNVFYFADPQGTLEPDRRFPFATLVNDDSYDDFSRLHRPSVFRLNIGVSKETFRALFGENALSDAASDDWDFTALDRIMPHPVYGKQFWVCVLNPSAATFHQDVQPLLTEAYERSIRRQTRTRPVTES
jgi:hypothetical protein